MKSPYEISGIITRFKNDFVELHHPAGRTMRILTNLEQCRTAALGGHVDACPSCGCIKISYNSCRNRHCPKCQGFEREKWIAARKEELLPVKYFHVVFTLPDVLNALALKYQREVYGALFHSAWETVRGFAGRQHIQPGMVALLHTWGSSLNYHPHLHCIVAAGGITPQGEWKTFPNASNDKAYLFPVKAMSRVFRAKFAALLGKQMTIPDPVRKGMFKKEWVVYCKAPFAATPMVVEYIGRYSHRVAITAGRITNVDDKTVSFSYKDYREKAGSKIMTLIGHEFLRRFCMHFLPEGFVKVRHYGFLASSNRDKLRRLQIAFNITPVPKKKTKKKWCEHYLERFGFSHRLCPFCKLADMITIQMMSPLARSPPKSIIYKADVNNTNLTGRNC